MPAEPTRFRVGADIGGTFTDLVVLFDDGRVLTRKVPSTPDDFGRAIVDGLARLLAEEGFPPGQGREMVHGTTVATNAILERRGAPTGLITTRGFRDTLEIGRLRYPRLYDLTWTKPVPLVPRQWRLEIGGRHDPIGNEVSPLDEDSVRAAAARFAADDVRSVAVCLLHSYANDSHEQRVAAILAEVAPEIAVSLSSVVLPEVGECERTSTTVINAYLRPIVGTYLDGLESGLATRGFRAPIAVMQSNGGVMAARAAAENPIHVIESGPAAGVIAARDLARQLSIADAIALDMGGTTAKGSIIEAGELLRAPEYEVGGGITVGSRLNRGGGYILRVPAIDIAEIGAGGGSIVSVDEAGALRVGPRSAGAVPGPVGYDAGGIEPTLTDANVLLGYLNPTALLGGALPIDAEAARIAFAARVAEPLGLDLLPAAHGVHQIAIASMVRVVKAVSSERGRDPRGYALIAFGGNGPLHATGVAAALGIGRVIVPPWPGLFSGFGLLVAQPQRHLSRTISRRLDLVDPTELDARYAALEEDARRQMIAEPPASYVLPLGEGQDEGVPSTLKGSSTPRIERFADCRYVGQSFELRLPIAGTIDRDALIDLAERFQVEHARTYGHRSDIDPIEIVHARVTATLPGRAPRPSIDCPTSVRSSSRPAYFGPTIGLVGTPVLARGDVGPTPVSGPLIVEEYDATTLVPPGWSIRRIEGESLRLETTA
ncbi:MAG: hydantoinase/oxoprolinase family protein [Chloroflexota bacterium]|nr:MAG: hydantoinase/oxoprolinase family protein [Chloroflexota bacterium]